MKKSLVIALVTICVVLLAVGLAGCSTSSKALTQDEINSATEFDSKTFFDAKSANEAKAEQDYQGNIYKVTATVKDIQSDYALANTMGNYNPVRLDMSKDELAKLSKGTSITFVGRLVKVDGTSGFTTFDRITIL